jgi:hypothetical protein
MLLKVASEMLSLFSSGKSSKILPSLSIREGLEINEGMIDSASFRI